MPQSDADDIGAGRSLEFSRCARAQSGTRVNLLALDTSSVACTVALQFDGTIIERHVEQAREHTRLLMPMIKDVLRASGARLTDLDALVLGNGPGSFIGLRIAASVAQGLAHGAGLNIIPVSSLAAVAAQVFKTSDALQVAVAQDAHLQEVYLGLFARDEEGLPTPIVDERLQRQELIPELSVNGRVQCLAAGFGWHHYPQLWTANEGLFCADAGIYYPRAEHLLPLAQSAVAVSPERIEPAYLRQKVAEKPLALKP